MTISGEGSVTPVAEFTVSGAVDLYGEEAGEGPPVVLLHGLTATRNYVIHGSRALERAGRRVVAYDARGHGRSSPATDYDYASLAADLETVLDDRGIDRAVLAGASMGAHTVVRFALDHPERVSELVLIVPAFDPDADLDMTRWNRLADGLRTGGIDGFIGAGTANQLPEKWRETAVRITRRRMEEHEHLGAVADALGKVPCSRPFERWEDLARIEAPTVVVASHDEADPEHPYAVASAYATTMPAARLISESHGDSPLAWQGGRLARIIAGDV
jgi:pimeloyl-ACP methyl ester carboxylesterase